MTGRTYLAPTAMLADVATTCEDAFEHIWHMHKDMAVTLRQAAYILAVNRVAHAERNRGFD